MESIFARQPSTAGVCTLEEPSASSILTVSVFYFSACAFSLGGTVDESGAPRMSRDGLIKHMTLLGFQVRGVLADSCSEQPTRFESTRL